MNSLPPADPGTTKTEQPEKNRKEVEHTRQRSIIENNREHTDPEIMAMREQLSLLQKKLDELICFEDNMLHKAMKRSASQLLEWEWVGLAICILAFVMAVPEVHNLHLSQGMQAFTAVWIGIMVAVQAWSVWFVSQKRRAIIGGNLLRASQRIVTYKRVDRWCKRIFLPTALVWMIAYLNEVVDHSTLATATAAYRAGVYVGGVAGALIGGGIGWAIYRKMMGHVNDLQQQINDLKREQ